MTRIPRALPAALAALSLLAAPAAAGAAPAKSTFTIRGAGFGHGVGMSQYGALGYAQHGWAAADILRHYYTGTQIGATDSSRQVRVLLQSAGTARFTGASQAGARTLDPAKSYAVRRNGLSQVDLLTSAGKKVATFTAPLQVAGPGGVLLRGRAGNGRTDGTYRGMLELRPATFGGLTVVNALSLEDYVQGVVPVESPASWPLEALKAQAVAARTYAITSSRGGGIFDQYADTRSQMYGGMGVETAATNLAVAQTQGQVVTYGGRPVTTYFFSTSGGRTEDVENTPLGSAPLPWLRSVDDPYDTVSPRHTWMPATMSLGQAGAKLRGLVRGRFRGITVLRRGESPRIVSAQVVGTRGTTPVSGGTLRARLGLFDTWAYFTTITVQPTPPVTAPVPAQPNPQSTGEGTGGWAARAGTAAARVGGLRGSVLPARPGATIAVQRRAGGGWTRVATVGADAAGRFTYRPGSAGTYRVAYDGATGPAVAVR